MRTNLHTVKCTAKSCTFDNNPTSEIIAFEIFVLILVVTTIAIGYKKVPKSLAKFGVIPLAVLIFEIFTSPMWNNHNMGWWAYMYRDLSWILTLGWSGLFFGATNLIDHFYKDTSPLKRFGMYLASLTAVVLPLESTVVALGIRSYTEEVSASLIGVYIGNLPVEAFFYVAVFSSLILGFYKYWELALDRRLLIPVKKLHTVRNFAISGVAVLLYEILIEPMAVNVGFVPWSYLYNDITFIMTGFWVVIIWLSMTLVNRFLIHLGLLEKFLSYLAVATMFSLPMEAWFIQNGFREYGSNSLANFSGITLPYFGVAVEIMFAIPAYLALVIAFIQYWQIVLDNKNV